MAEFGRLLATRVNQDSVVREIIAAQVDADLSKNTQFIGGYFSGLRATNSDQWERFVQELLASERTRALGITVVLYSGWSESVLGTLLQMFRSKAVDASVFNGFGWEAPKAGFPPQIIEDVLQALVGADNEQSLRVAIDLAHYYFFNKKDPHSCDEHLVFQLITAPSFFRRDHSEHHDYAWYQVTKGFRERFPHRDIEILKTILSSENELASRHSNYPTQVADAIAHDHPAMHGQ